MAKKKDNIVVDYSEKVKELEEINKQRIETAKKNLKEQIKDRNAQLSAMVDRQYDLLIEFSTKANEERRQSIKKEMYDRQLKMDEMLKQVEKSFTKYEKSVDSETRTLFRNMQKTTAKNMYKILGEMNDRFDDMTDVVDDAVDEMSKAFTQKFAEAAAEVREFAMQLNIDSIASSLSDSVDNYVETMRDIRRRTGDNFNEHLFQKTVSDIVDSTATYSRAEAANLAKEVIGSSAVKDAKFYRPYLTEIANTTKALGSSFEDMADIMYIDMGTTDEKERGSLMRSVDNVAFALEMNHDLNVDGHDLLRSINENIHGIYGLSEGDSNRQVKMVKSLSVIEGIQQTTYNKGISHMGDQFKEWMTKSRLELLEDENFINYMNYSGASVEDFLQAQQSPEKMKELLVGYTKAAADAEAMGEASLHAMAQAIGLTDAGLKEAAMSFKNGEIQEVGDNILKSLNKENKGSLAAHQAGKGSGIVEKFWNKVSDNFVVRGISDVFANFDMKLANMANAAIVASKGAELWQSFKQYRIDNKTFFDTFKKDGFFKAIKGTERYQQSMADGMVKTVKESSFFKKFFTGDFGKYVSKPIGSTLGKLFKTDTYKALYRGIVDGFGSFWNKFVSKGIGSKLFGGNGLFKNIFKGVGNALGKILPGYTDILNFGKAMEGATGKTAEVFGKSVKPVASFTDKIVNFFSKFSGAAKFLKGLPLVSMVIDSVFGIFKTTDWFGEGASIGDYIISGLTSAIAGSGGGLGNDGIFSVLIDVVGNGFKGAAAGAVFGPHGAIAGAVIGAVTAAIGGERIAKAVGWLKDNILELPFKFFDGVSSVFGYLKETTTGWIDTVANFLKHPFDSIFGSKKEEKKETVLSPTVQATGFSDVSLKEWMSKSRKELLEDESFVNFMDYSGVSMDEFLKAKTNPNEISEIAEILGIIAKNSSEQLKEEKDTTKFAFENFKKTGLFAKSKKDSIFEKLKKSLFGDKETGSVGLAGSIKNSVSSFGSSVSSGLGSIVGSNPAKASTSSNENQRKIWNFFKEKGMSEAGIAGLMGNLRAESNLESNIVEGGSHANEITLNGKTGYGLAQWTSLNRQQGLYDYAKSKGTSTSDLNTQLEYLWQELNGSYKSVLSRLMNATSVQEASNAVLHDFESPFDQSKSVEDLRASYGLEIQKENASLANSVTTGNTGITELPGIGNSFVDKQTELASLKVNTQNTNAVPVSAVPNTSPVEGTEDVSKVSNDIVYSNPSPVPDSNSKDVVDTMKWQVYRLESKLDKLIMVMSGQQNNRRGNIIPNGPSETDLAFSSL